MKKKILKIFIFILVVLLFSYFVYLFKSKPSNNKEQKEENKEEVKLEVTGITNEICDTSKEFYFEAGGIRYYLSCLSHVNVKLGKNEYSLEDAIKNDVITMDDIISKMSNGDAIPEIASIIYKSEENSEVSNLSIIKCSTQVGNKDYYIGNNTLKYEKGFCERNCKFTKTYHILNVEANSDNNYYDVTIMQYGGDEITTVKVKKELMEKYKMNAAYEFTFRKDELDYTDDDSIKNLFNTFVLDSIAKTDKEKEEQIQEEICRIK